MTEPRSSLSASAPRRPSLSPSPSHIPIIAPKPVKSSLPSSLTSPQLNLGDSSRHMSVGESPSHPTASTSTNNTRPSGLPSLRSLRSLLHLGSGSGGQSGSVGGGAGAVSPGRKDSSSNIAGGRRSLANERKASGTFLRPAAPAVKEEDTVVMSIQASPRQRKNAFKSGHSPISSPGQASRAVMPDSSMPSPSRSEDPLEHLPGKSSSTSPMSSLEKDKLNREREHHGAPHYVVSQRLREGSSSDELGFSDTSRDIMDRSVDSENADLPLISYEPDPPLSHELSTILESDLSGLSRHLPALSDNSRDETDGDLSLDELTARHNAPGASHFLRPEIGNSPVSPHSLPRTPESRDTSDLDLSTSDLKNEVMNAMKGHRASWLDPCEVEDASDSAPASPNQDDPAAHAGQDSFELDALDPDLAALLSPNRLALSSTPAPAITPPPPPFAVPSTSSGVIGRSYSPLQRGPPENIGFESSPVRPIRPRFLRGHSANASVASSSSIPRPYRAANERISPIRDNFADYTGSSRSVSDTTLPGTHDRRVSEDGVLTGRRAPPSPLSPDLPRSSLDRAPFTRSTSQRLATPGRPALYNPVRLLRHAVDSATNPSRWDSESTSPSSRAGSGNSPTSRAPSVLSRASSSLGMRRAPPPPRSSIDDTRRPSLNLDRGTLGYRTRNRSLSVNGADARGDAIGPRTARAFAAAGVLDQGREQDRDRFGSVRSLERYGAPSRLAFSDIGGAPSRHAFSEAGSGSWRSASRAGTELAFDTPRTSTAATSISRAPSPNVQAVLKEKHAMETGVLLSALADSQRTASQLRDENAALRTRVDELEADLVRAHSQLRMAQRAQVQPPFRERAPYSPISRPGSADGQRPIRRVQPRVSPVTSLLPAASIDSEEEPTYHPGDRLRPLHNRKPSSSGSVFARPPSDMDLLMHEPVGAPASLRSALSASPLARSTSPSQESPPPTAREYEFARDEFTSSRLANREGDPLPSPTATSFTSNTDGPSGSPRSLFLHPEHEQLLGDMPSIELDGQRNSSIWVGGYGA
ncbi:hypothetical protein PENSPDRAFT_753393 [Peniophora sp. CONT]|nr:hypothetical protein PENSPDRAFT_753393 [Peniophora sp. CONT]